MASGPAPVEVTKAPEEYRLPGDVKPSHYDVTIRTDLEKLKFDGFVIAQYVHYFFHLATRLDTEQSRRAQRDKYIGLQYREAVS